MTRLTKLEDMVKYAKVGDKLIITDADDWVYGTVGTIEQNEEGLYNVKFDDGYGDDDWQDVDIQELIEMYFETWDGFIEIETVDNVDKVKIEPLENGKHEYGLYVGDKEITRYTIDENPSLNDVIDKLNEVIEYINKM